MNRSFWMLNCVGTTALLVGVLLVFEITDLDIVVQDWFFLGRPHEWVVNAKEPVGKLFFYTGVKVVLVMAGIGLALAWAASFRFPALQPYRRQMALVVLSLVVVPSVIAMLKSTTNVYWPDQLHRYGGDKPYVKVFESYPRDYRQTKRGYGFPAGHASGGFALMSLCFIFRSRKASLFGWLTGFGLGWIMGIYQMAKGVHFLSHTLVTMLGAWLLILLLCRLVEPPAGKECPGACRPGSCAG